MHLITNSLLLTRSLTSNINSWWTHILYLICIMYYILIKKRIREKTMVRKGKYSYKTGLYLLKKIKNKKPPTSEWTRTGQTHVVQGPSITEKPFSNWYHYHETQGHTVKNVQMGKVFPLTGTKARTGNILRIRNKLFRRFPRKREFYLTVVTSTWVSSSHVMWPQNQVKNY